MKAQKPTCRFWTVLAALNGAAIVYPLSLFLRADASDGNLLATIALVGVAFVLMITDAVSILVAYS